MPSAEALYQGSQGDRFRLVLDVTLLSQSAANNTSTVRINAYLRNVSSSTVWNSDPTYANYQYNGNLINTTINGYGNGGSSYPVGSTWNFAAANQDVVIPHNSDGTKTANFYAYHNGQNLPFLGEASVSFNYTLPSLATIPTVTTTSASSIQANTVQVGGNVTNSGNATITQRGIYYSIVDTTPDSDDLRKTVSGTTGAFSTSLTALFPNTKYYYRAYAINSKGTGFGAVRTFTTGVTPFASLTYDNTQPYADGIMLRDTGSNWQPFTGDLYFETYSDEGETTVPQNSLDPSVMITNALDFFNANGGVVTYTGSPPTIEEVINLSTNPSFEVNISNWTAFQGTISRSSFSSAQGGYHLILQNVGGGGADGQVTGNLVSGRTYTVSYYAKATSGSTHQITGTHNSGNVFTNSSVATTWTRYSHQFTATANTPLTMGMEVGGSDLVIEIDGIMITEGTTLYDYFDGSTTDAGEFTYDWDGTSGLSTSTRSEQLPAVAGSVDYTGSVSSYTFVTQTVYEVINKALQLSPNDWYWYVDPSTNLLNFKLKNELPEHKLILGKDILDMSIEKKGENIVNVVYFTGGDTGGGSILYKKYQNLVSIGLYGQRATKIIDQRVTNPDTAEQIANNYLNKFALPEIRLRVKIADSNYASLGYDIETIQVGQTVNIQNVAGSTGSSLWDVALFDIDRFDFNTSSLSSQNLQIVRKEYNTDSLDIICSNIPPEVTKRIEDISRNLENSQTANNPSQPT